MNVSNIIDGRAIADKILEKVKYDAFGKQVRLAIFWSGDNPAIGAFVHMKTKKAFNLGIDVIASYVKTSDELKQRLISMAGYKGINGIAIELPLPKDWNREELLDLVPVEKDVDVLSQSAQNKFYSGESDILPPAVGALKALFDEHKVEVAGKTAAIFGQSILIGKPISHWLEKQGAKVFRIDENTLNPAELSTQADIIVSGVGKPGLISAEMVKDGAAVVDFGFEKLGGKVVGDVDFDSVASKTSLITPVPGGMGPILIAEFLANTVRVGVK